MESSCQWTFVQLHVAEVVWCNQVNCAGACVGGFRCGCNQVNLQVHVRVQSGEFSGAVVGGCNQVQLKCAHSAMHFTAHPPSSTSLLSNQFYQFFQRFFRPSSLMFLSLVHWQRKVMKHIRVTLQILSHIILPLKQSNLTLLYPCSWLAEFFTYWNFKAVKTVVFLNWDKRSYPFHSCFDLIVIFDFEKDFRVRWLLVE